MPSLASLRTHSSAFVAQLEAEAVGTLARVGDARKPPGAGWQQQPGQSEFVPYLIVYPLPVEFDGHLAASDDQAWFYWQVTCVGETREQAEWGMDLAIAAFVGRTLTVTSRDVARVTLDDAAGGVRADETVQPTVFIATPRFRAWSTPA